MLILTMTGVPSLLVAVGPTPMATSGLRTPDIVRMWDALAMIGYFLKYEVLETFSKISEVKLKKKVFNLVLVVK